MGKPDIAPDELFRHPEDFYVIIAVGEAIDEILGILKKNGFPQAQVLSCFWLGKNGLALSNWMSKAQNSPLCRVRRG